MNRVNGEGSSGARLVIVGEAPGYEEDQECRPFVGASGQYLNRLLKSVGLVRGDSYVTNVYKYRPPNNSIKEGQANPIWSDYTRDYKEELFTEINQIKPNLILALGNTALKVLTGKDGIKKYRGSILQSFAGPKVIPTFHPAHILRPKDSEVEGFWQKFVIQLDFQRAAEEVKLAALDLPIRSLGIARNSLDVHRFFERAQGSQYLSADIESHLCVPSCIGFAYSPKEAISIPLMNTNYSMSERVEMWRYVAKALKDPRWKKIGQNFKYDEPKLNMLGFYLDGLHADTMLMMHTAYPELPQSLAFQTSILTREPYYKDDGKDWEGKGDIKQLYTYNARDAAVTYECFLKLEEELKGYNVYDFYYNFVNKLHKFYLDMEKVGFETDRFARQLLIWQYDALEKNAQGMLEGILGEPFNIDSHIKFRKLFLTKLKFPDRESLDEDTIVALLGNHAKTQLQKAGCELALNLRKYKKTKSTYLLSPCDYDGKMRTSFRITGTETGRSSTNKLKPPVRPTQVGLMFHNLTKHGEIGPEIRSYLKASDGFVLYEVDCKQAEARVVCVLAKAFELLEKFDTIDIHRWTAGLIFTKEMQNITPDERFIGKTVRHAGNYDAGKAQLMRTVITDSKKYDIDIQISEWKAGKILEAFHQFTPEIRQVFHREVRDIVEQTKILRTPFGRVRQFFNNIDDHTIKEAYAEIPQSTIPDHVRRAGLASKDECPEMQFINEHHDALIGQARVNELDDQLRLLRRHLLKPINFGECSLSRDFDLVIPVDIKVGENLRDLQEYEVT
jgi:DNA polymerase